MALAEVKHPPFTRGKKQLEKVDVDWTRELGGIHANIVNEQSECLQKSSHYNHDLAACSYLCKLEPTLTMKEDSGLSDAALLRRLEGTSQEGGYLP